MNQDPPYRAIQFSGETPENWIWTMHQQIANLDLREALTISNFNNTDQNQAYINLTKYLDRDLIAIITFSEALYELPGNDPANFQNLAQLLTYCQEHHRLAIVYDVLFDSYRLGNLREVSNQELFRQRQTFAQALARDQIRPLIPTIIENHQMLFRANDRQEFYLVIADLSEQCQYPQNRAMLYKEIGAIFRSLRELLKLPLHFEPDLIYLDDHQEECLAKFEMEDVQSNHRNGLAFVKLKVLRDIELTLLTFYLSGEKRLLLPDETDFSATTRKSKKQTEGGKTLPAKASQRVYLCSIMRGPIPRAEHMALRVMGVRSHEAAFYASLLVAKARDMANIDTIVLSRSYNLQQIKKGENNAKFKHHFNAIALMVFVTTLEEVTSLQISFGLGKKLEQLARDTQVKVHYLDHQGAFPVHVAKNPEAHHGKKFDHRKFAQVGFAIDGITLAAHRHIVALLPRSTSWINEWQNHPNLVAVHSGPTLTSQSNGESKAGVFSLYFRFSRAYTTPPFHALDPVVKASGIGGIAPKYVPLSALSNGVPAFFGSVYLALEPGKYPNEAVPDFKQTDEDKAKKSYEEKAPAARRATTITPGQEVLPPTDWMVNFLREQAAPQVRQDLNVANYPLLPLLAQQWQQQRRGRRQLQPAEDQRRHQQEFHEQEQEQQRLQQDVEHREARRLVQQQEQQREFEQREDQRRQREELFRQQQAITQRAQHHQNRDYNPFEGIADADMSESDDNVSADERDSANSETMSQESTQSQSQKTAATGDMGLTQSQDAAGVAAASLSSAAPSYWQKSGAPNHPNQSAGQGGLYPLFAPVGAALAPPSAAGIVQPAGAGKTPAKKAANLVTPSNVPL